MILASPGRYRQTEGGIDSNYHKQISDAVSPVRAAQFLQIENQVAIFVDLNIASEMPLVDSAVKRMP